MSQCRLQRHAAKRLHPRPARNSRVLSPQSPDNLRAAPTNHRRSSKPFPNARPAREPWSSPKTSAPTPGSAWTSWIATFFPTSAGGHSSRWRLPCSSPLACSPCGPAEPGAERLLDRRPQAPRPQASRCQSRRAWPIGDPRNLSTRDRARRPRPRRSLRRNRSQPLRMRRPRRRVRPGRNQVVNLGWHLVGRRTRRPTAASPVQPRPARSGCRDLASVAARPTPAERAGRRRSWLRAGQPSRLSPRQPTSW